MSLTDDPEAPLGALPPSLTLDLRRASGGHMVQVEGKGCPAEIVWVMDADLTVRGTVGGHPVMATRPTTRVWVWPEGWAVEEEVPWSAVVDLALERAWAEAMGKDMSTGDLRLVGPSSGPAAQVTLEWVPLKGKVETVRVWRAP